MKTVRKLKTVRTERTYVFLGEKKKMIPKKYFEIALKIDYDFSKVRLSKEERFNLELELFKENLKKNEPFVFELIVGEKISGVFSVKGLYENRHEVKFGKYGLKCNVLLFNMAPENMKNNKVVNY